MRVDEGYKLFRFRISLGSEDIDMDTAYMLLPSLYRFTDSSYRRSIFQVAVF